ncbi:GntR family transcriptional regulator [Dactylosporangium sp. CA-092794]|uniref:GntR family transcriptional regulator n=1 Tax=Dactylosporangium sp. CA-092794 TaxID=3239929 RepID=UPI003D94D0AE
MTVERFALPELGRPETLAQRAYAALRRAIREGQLQQGSRYSENALGASMGISRTPVREALIELEREGIIDIIPQKGFQLRVLSAAEQDEVFELRAALESLVVERLARRASADDVMQLRVIIQQQRGLASDPSGFLELDERFHLSMPMLLGMGRTHRMLATLRGAMWLMGSAALRVHDRTSSIIDEHTAIVDAISGGDIATAVSAVHHHLETTAAAIRQHSSAG